MMNDVARQSSGWDTIIQPKSNLLNIPWRDLWFYRDLLRMFVKRDVITVYKQTVLGPIWYILQPILTTIIYIFIFGNVAGISTDGVPQPLFYMTGIIVWNYFSECFNSTSKTFFENANVFGKVYFPRLIMPLSKVTSSLIKFFIQLLLFLIILTYYVITSPSIIEVNLTVLLVPFYIVLMAMLGLGSGLIFTSLTVKYRDLNFLIQFGVQLLMYASPVIYPVSSIPQEYKIYILLNPITSVLEAVKYGFLGAGNFNPAQLAYSTVFALVIMAIGIIIFNRTERNFVDTI